MTIKDVIGLLINPNEVYLLYKNIKRKSIIIDNFNAIEKNEQSNIR